MSKYQKLWNYVSEHCKDKLVLTFSEIQDIVGIQLDHSFLQYKKVLLSYGYKTEKISLKNQTVAFSKLQPQSDTSVIYIHGKGENAKECENFRPLFPNCNILGLNYKSTTPKSAAKEFPQAFDALANGCKHIILIANSIGAYFAMHALKDKNIEKAYFISPITDMEKLIYNMMIWANVTEQELQSAKTIKTTFGETLSWDYLQYVRSNPVCWNVPTHILYGEKDNLTSFETISSFAEKNNFSLTIMKNGEHWFHTPEQMNFLANWIKEKELQK